MFRAELEHNNKKYRLRILEQDPMSELEVKKKYVGEVYKNIHDQYFRVQVEDTQLIGPGVSLAYSDILIISPELCEKIKQLYPNLVLVKTGIYNTIDKIPETTEILKDSDKPTLPPVHDKDAIYLIIENYVLTEAYIPPYKIGAKFTDRSRVQYYDTVTNKLYNLDYTLPLGLHTRHAGSIAVNRSTEMLDKYVIEIGKTSHNLSLIKVI